MSYMEITSLDGNPTVVDRIRVWRLRFTRPLVIEGKPQRALYLRLGYRLLWFVATVGLSGFVLYLFNE